MPENVTVESISEFEATTAQRKAVKSTVELVVPPQLRGNFIIDKSVTAAFPVPGTRIVHAFSHIKSLWGQTAKITVQLPSGDTRDYFIKEIAIGAMGSFMCEGEFESLKAIHAVAPRIVPEPYTWGRYHQHNRDLYFLLEEYRDIGDQPAKPAELATCLADLHQRSISPTGKFGFHVATCHGKIIQAVDSWEDSWCLLFTRHLGHVMDMAKPILSWPEFDVVCELTLEKVVPRLLLPLQAEGRFLKPCLLHGDCWDGNTGQDRSTGEALIFDVCSFYGHNEYDTGNWRTRRHQLSDEAYIKSYKEKFPVSEPKGDWDARNRLYSLTFNIGNTMHIPDSTQRQVIYDDMTILCNMFCYDDLESRLSNVGHEKP